MEVRNSVAASRLATILFLAGTVTIFILAFYTVPNVWGSLACRDLSQDLYLEEAGSAEESTDECWWLNSGAIFTITGNVGETLHGPISSSSPWRALYEISDPMDTDGGFYPQNLFRLVSKRAWGDVRESVYAKIDTYHTSASSNRNRTNGIFLFARYVDSDNLYLAGVRVDGTAVIKRKSGGVYETLGIVTLDDSGRYDRGMRPSLLETNEWTGLRMEVKNLPNGMILIRLDIDDVGAGEWHTVLTAFDRPPPAPPNRSLLSLGSVGIRSDFMDVKFRDYKISPL